MPKLGTAAAGHSGCMDGEADESMPQPGDAIVSGDRTPTSPSQVVRESQDDQTRSGSTSLSIVRERLEQDRYFRGRSSLFRMEVRNGVVIVSGRVPSFYLKQLLQEAIRKIPGVTDIDNRVEVVSGAIVERRRGTSL